MIRDDVVDEVASLSGERFNRLLAVYQMLPGPEATEMCAPRLPARWVDRREPGEVGFVLPGLVQMLGLPRLYVHPGASSPWVLSLLAGFRRSVTSSASGYPGENTKGYDTVTIPPLWGFGNSILRSCPLTQDSTAGLFSVVVLVAADVTAPSWLITNFTVNFPAISGCCVSSRW